MASSASGSAPAWAADIDGAAVAAALGVPLGAVSSLAFSRERELEQSNVAALDAALAPNTRLRGEAEGTRSSGAAAAAPEAPSAAAPSVPLLLKRANVAWLRARLPKSDAKWDISVRSFRNELAFHAVNLRWSVSRRLDAFGAPVVAALAVDERDGRSGSGGAANASADASTSATQGEAAVAWDRVFTVLLERLPVADADAPGGGGGGARAASGGARRARW
jgi:hypothetical protein